MLDRVRNLDAAAGRSGRTLRIGDWDVRLEGIEDDLARSLDRRWGGFVRTEQADRPRMTIRMFRGEDDLFLSRERIGEKYRIEAVMDGGVPLLRSYGFAACPEEATGWRVALAGRGEERPDRVVDNAVRCVLERVALEEGGFALHAAAVLRGGSAYLFAGPSNVGKTTAVALSEPCVNLGDDLVLVLPVGGTWSVPASPFDNAEQAPPDPPAGLFPVKGVWRLFQAGEHRVETVPAPADLASILACVALVHTMPGLEEALVENLKRFVADVPFAHLHFRRDPGFWSLLE